MKDNWLTDLGRILIISINLILFFSLEINEGKVLDNPSFFELSYYTTKVILTVLGILMLIFFTYMTTIQGIVMIGIQKAKAIREEDQSNERSRSSRLFTLVSYMLSHKEETLKTRNIWCLLFCLGFSIAGMSVDFFWFSFTMMYPLIFSPQILEVTNAIWNPKRRIVSTIVLSGVVLYWFGVIAYVFFGSEFDGAVGNSNQTLRRTLAVIFDAWHNFGLGAFLTEWGRSAIYEDTGNGEYEYRLKGAVMCFNFLFFFVVNTLLLNILSGIIIDNFAERRSKSDAIHERQNDLCFICGELSSDLPDFKRHCKYKHNIWDYMCYFIF